MSAYHTVVRPLTADEYATLKDDIQARGIVMPIVRDSAGNIVDGFHRHKIAQELGIDCPEKIIEGTDADMRATAIALNVARRQLSAEDRDALIVELRLEGKSTREIAEKLGTSKGTVGRALQAAPSGAPERVTGADGKSYPTRTPSKPKPSTVPVKGQRTEDAAPETESRQATEGHRESEGDETPANAPSEGDAQAQSADVTTEDAETAEPHEPSAQVGRTLLDVYRGTLPSGQSDPHQIMSEIVTEVILRGHVDADRQALRLMSAVTEQLRPFLTAWEDETDDKASEYLPPGYLKPGYLFEGYGPDKFGVAAWEALKTYTHPKIASVTVDRRTRLPDKSPRFPMVSFYRTSGDVTDCLHLTQDDDRTFAVGGPGGETCKGLPSIATALSVVSALAARVYPDC